MKSYEITLKYTVEEVFTLEFENQGEAEEYALRSIPENAFLEDIEIKPLEGDNK